MRSQLLLVEQGTNDVPYFIFCDLRFIRDAGKEGEIVLWSS